MSVEETYVGGETDYAPWWKPEPGESITGRMVSVHVLDGDYGPTPVLTLETSEGEQAVLVRGTVFREEMAKRQPKIGDELTITYLGKKAPKSGKGMPFHVYRVKGGQEPEFNWGQYTDPSRRQDSNEPPIDASPIPAQPTVQQRAAESFPDDEVPF